MPSYIEQLKAYLDGVTAPASSGLWNYSTGNRLPVDWLLATPTAVWGTPYRDFKMSVKGSYPDFELRTCTAADGPTQLCEVLPATVKAPGQEPAKLLVGHSEAMVEAVYDVMTSAETFVDVTLLSPPTGRFLAAMRNAVTFLSRKPEGQRPTVRVLYSNSPDILAAAVDLLTDLVRDVDRATPMNVYACVMSSAQRSWNHSKIIAADGARSLVGGHNLWAAHYLDVNPVFDVSMKLEGQAALHAHDYADFLWQYLLQSLPKSFWNAFNFNNVAAYVRDPATNRYAAQKGAKPAADVYTKIRSQLRPPATGNVAVLSVGRKGSVDTSRFLPDDQSYLDSHQEPGDAALVKLVSLAQSKIRISQHALTFLIARFTWNFELFMAMGRAVQRGVEVTITESNPGARASANPISEMALYDGDAPSSVNQYMLEVLTTYQNVSPQAAKELIRDRFHVTSFRYSSEEKYPIGPTPIPNHAKTLIVDDRVFYIGSQNLYTSGLNEFGYIVEDPTLAQAYCAAYWLPLWEQAKRTEDTTYSDELSKQMDGEALLFVLELRRNRRLAKTWNDTIEERKDKTSPEDLEETAVILNDILAKAGSNASSTHVLRVLKSPFFTTQRDDHTANDASRRFVKNLMSDKALLEAFVALVKGQSGSDADTDAAVTRFLGGKGYACNATQIAAAIDQLRGEMLAYWGGEYDGWLVTDNGTSYTNFTPHEHDDLRRRNVLAATVAGGAPAQAYEGPKLTVVDNITAKLDDDTLKGIKFQNGVLSWDAAAGNKTSGSVTLSQITQPGIDDPFTGYEAFGTLTWPDSGAAPNKGIVSYYARWNESVNVDNPDKPVSFPWPVGVILGLLGLVGVAAAGFFVARNRRARAQQEAYEVYKKTDGDIELQPILAEESTAREQASDAYRSGSITREEFDDEISEIDGREAAARSEWGSSLDDSRRALDRGGWVLGYRSPEAVRDVYDGMKSSLVDMIRRRGGAAREDLGGSALRTTRSQALASSVPELREEVQGVTVETKAADLGKLFARISKSTNAVNEYVTTTARARASGNAEWLETARRLDEERVTLAESANDARAKIDWLDKDSFPPEDEFRIPEERIDLPEFGE